MACSEIKRFSATPLNIPEACKFMPYVLSTVGLSDQRFGP